ncbi:hypothetical protein GGU11DRAFT_709595 [Lentinula aff. detonsa]|nr:hypothetical protein GGU11DRAFT_709595 [Lentinula aff. detonsa]
MSTRTTRSTRTSMKQATARSSAPPSKISKVPNKSHDMDIQSGKENKNTKDISPQTVPSARVLTSKDSAVSITASDKDKSYCTCKKGDDGTPMIHCSECKDWLHFSCINLDETDAEDISIYVCPSCTEKTGLHTLSESFCRLFFFHVSALSFLLPSFYPLYMSHWY